MYNSTACGVLSLVFKSLPILSLSPILYICLTSFYPFIPCLSVSTSNSLEFSHIFYFYYSALLLVNNFTKCLYCKNQNSLMGKGLKTIRVIASLEYIHIVTELFCFQILRSYIFNGRIHNYIYCMSIKALMGNKKIHGPIFLFWTPGSHPLVL